MKTLRSYWEDYFVQNEEVLSQHYPGINLFIFMRELKDLLLIHHPIISLDDALVAIGSAPLKKLQDAFYQGIPFAYLLKFSEFYGRRFYVDHRVLIPRPETEYLIELLMNHRQKNKKPFESLLDIGTGSGVIVHSLMANKFALRGVASDISPDALEVARLNGQRLRTNVQFVLSDRLKNITESFHVIVSNPPYIKESSHREGVHQAVDKHEPHLALFLKDEEYGSWFQDFFAQVLSGLSPGGLFMMEGHERELQEQSEILRHIGFADVKVVQDLTGRDRFLEAWKR